MGTITVIGSINMDLVVRTPKMPQGGETLAGSDFHMIPGGKGANQAVAAARAGASTRMVGCIGTDAFGPALLDSLSQAGVDVSGIQQLEHTTTGSAAIIVENGGQNRIIVVAGANGMVTPEYIQLQWPAIRKSDYILLQHEIPLETVHTAIQQGRSEGVRVILNPAPVYDIPSDLLPMIDILIVNEGEAAALSGLEVFDLASARKAALSLCGQGVESVIITLGARGAVLCNPQHDLIQPAFAVEPVDTTAAGDTFTGGYAACILRGYKPPEALLYATAASALAVTRLGAQTSIPTRAEVESFIAHHTAENEQLSLIHNHGGG
jgi:ribokinase